MGWCPSTSRGLRRWRIHVEEAGCCCDSRVSKMADVLPALLTTFVRWSMLRRPCQCQLHFFQAQPLEGQGSEATRVAPRLHHDGKGRGHGTVTRGPAASGFFSSQGQAGLDPALVTLVSSVPAFGWGPLKERWGFSRGSCARFCSAWPAWCPFLTFAGSAEAFLVRNVFWVQAP